MRNGQKICINPLLSLRRGAFLINNTIFKNNFFGPLPPNLYLNRGYHSNQKVFPFSKMVLKLILGKKLTDLELFE